MSPSCEALRVAVGGTFGGSNKTSASQHPPISIACFIGPCRHRVEQAGSWPLSELHFYCLNDAFKIACELLVVMMRRYNRHILSVIAKIENYQVKVNEQVLPVGKVGISGKAVAMGK